MYTQSECMRTQLRKYFGSNPKTVNKQVKEVNKDMEETDVRKQDIMERHTFRGRFKKYQGFLEVEKKTKQNWAEERKTQFSERMKEYSKKRRGGEIKK